ncbi:hypothetical protein IJJ08_01125 [bacterium]|nr:hypothetical protein [bacterium]
MPTDSNASEWYRLADAVNSQKKFFRVTKTGGTGDDNVSEAPSPWNATGKSTLAGTGGGANSSMVYYQDKHSQWWSSTNERTSNSGAYIMDARGDHFSYTGACAKWGGFSVRCLLGNTP